MTPSARIQAVLDLLLEIEKTPRPADALVSAYFRARRYIGSHDRAAISAMLYDILRHRARLEWWIELKGENRGRVPLPLREGSGEGSLRKKAVSYGETTPHQQKLRLAEGGKPKFLHPLPQGERNTKARPLLLAYLSLVSQKPLRDIESSFSGGKFSPAALDDSEKKLLRKLENHTIEHPDMPDEIRAECPDWAAAPLKQKFGNHFMREMQALLEHAPLDLRVNPIKATREDILAELKKLGFNAAPCPLSPFGIRIQERPNLSALPMLKNGLVEIQDEGSQLVALAVDARPGMRVVDFCAGAGGKTLAIAAQMQNKGRITACDVLAKRLERSTERFRRAGLHNIEVKPLKDERDPWVKKHKGDFDRVLVDAPCTGVGAWRRNPDARWRSLGPGLEALLPLQAGILDSAARLVKKGGRLIYATCSLLPEENELQVEKFLETHKEFHLIPYHSGKFSAAIVEENLSGIPCSTGHKPRNDNQETYLSLTPAQHNTDGFFAAILERR